MRPLSSLVLVATRARPQARNKALKVYQSWLDETEWMWTIYENDSQGRPREICLAYGYGTDPDAHCI
jgi:hypothetical protein